MQQAELVAKLDTFFSTMSFDESGAHQDFPAGYESVFQRFAAPGFWESGWNGLMLSNANRIDRVYLVVFPSQGVLDTIIAREVQRGAPGAMIFCHHVADYAESGPGSTYITEEQLEELQEHNISYYVCHVPLDCHPEISTSIALANALRLKEQARFAMSHDQPSGVYGTVSLTGFHDFALRICEAVDLPLLRYSAIRNNGKPIHQVAVIAGLGGRPRFMREAAELGCDTLVTGEWWLFGPGEWRAQHRDRMREALREIDMNLIGTSHYASEAVVMREMLPGWFRENIPGVEPVFVPQEDPWR